MNLAVIPARGGSKRIPGKNIRLLGGEPVLARTLQAVQRSGVFDRIVVSTDDPEIARVAREAGAEMPFMRPAELADDMTATRPVVQHAVAASEIAFGTRAELVGCIYPTAALVLPEDYQDARSKLEHGSADMVFTAVEYPHPIERAWRAAEGGLVRMIRPEHAGTRTQDLEPSYHDAGQFYLGRRGAWMAASAPESRAMVLLPRYRAVDVDSEEDWALLELLFERVQEPRMGAEKS